jgi:rhamnose transport system ATP-binding protein
MTAQSPGDSDTTPILAMSGVHKTFGAVRALQGVDLALFTGEAHALVGENGAGKSTLVKILAGAHRPDSGTTRLEGKVVDLSNPAAATDAGIAVIYQEPTLFSDLTVAENIFIGRQPLRSLRRIDTREMNRQCEALFDRLGVRLDPQRPARGLSIADQQLVEIAKALSFDARILIMDEPTAALSGVEVDRLFSVVRSLCETGSAVLFVSHRLDEVFSLCRRVSVLRDGAWVSTDLTSDLTPDQVIRRMVGREISAMFPKRETAIGDPVLEVRDLARVGSFDDISFSVRRGEIVAIAGLVGAGRSEVARAIFGVDHYDHGAVLVNGKRLPPGRPAAAMRAGVALVPEDRRQQGLVMELSVERNANLTRRWALSRLGWLSRRTERANARRWTDTLQVKTATVTAPVSTLSGGNQQKLVLAKWLATQPQVLIVDEPTRGIDVATKAEVHRLLSELAGNGVAVLMVSSELPEVLGMADRVLVMHEGRLTGELDRTAADEESVMAAATGQLQERA